MIDSIEQINEILDGLKKHPKSITYNLTHDILSRIKVRKVFDHYKEELRIDIEENEWHSEGIISKDGWYAKIENYYGDKGSEPAVTEFRIGNIYQ